MSEAPLMNDEAARSSTGEILDQAQTTVVEPKTPTTTTPTNSTTETTTLTPTTETKDGTTVLTKPAESETKPAAVVPEKYADFKAPEGYTLDPKLLETALPIFKELGLTQDQAQKLVDIQSAQMIAAAKGPQDAYTALRTDWQSKVAADPELKAATSGGKIGLDAVKLDVGRALNALGDTTLVNDFKSAMDLTGAGDHPAFVKAFWKLSQFIIEGKHVSGSGPSIAGQRGPNDRPKSIANALYPNLP